MEPSGAIAKLATLQRPPISGFPSAVSIPPAVRDFALGPERWSLPPASVTPVSSSGSSIASVNSRFVEEARLTRAGGINIGSLFRYGYQRVSVQVSQGWVATRVAVNSLSAEVSAAVATTSAAIVYGLEILGGAVATAGTAAIAGVVVAGSLPGLAITASGAGQKFADWMVPPDGVSLPPISIMPAISLKGGKDKGAVSAEETSVPDEEICPMWRRALDAVAAPAKGFWKGYGRFSRMSPYGAGILTNFAAMAIADGAVRFNNGKRKNNSTWGPAAFYLFSTIWYGVEGPVTLGLLDRYLPGGSPGARGDLTSAADSIGGAARCENTEANVRSAFRSLFRFFNRFKYLARPAALSLWSLPFTWRHMIGMQYAASGDFQSATMPEYAGKAFHVWKGSVPWILMAETFIQNALPLEYRFLAQRFVLIAWQVWATSNQVDYDNGLPGKDDGNDIKHPVNRFYANAKQKEGDSIVLDLTDEERAAFYGLIQEAEISPFKSDISRLDPAPLPYSLGRSKPSDGICDYRAYQIVSKSPSFRPAM